MQTTLDRLLSGFPLSADDNQAIFAAMLSGQMSEAEVAAILAAWRVRGEGSGELYAGAVSLRRHAIKLTVPESTRPIIDNCGTGGDGSNSFNLSTAAAIVAASAGAHVAKHGNRSVSSRCGSADLLFAAGFPSTLSPEAAGSLLAKTGFTFFFAPNFHPLLAHVAPVRKQLRVRTIFNLLGPLANPLTPEYQVIGVGAPNYLRPMAEALSKLGVRRGLVVHARDGLDELSPSALTDALYIENGLISSMLIDPVSMGVKATNADLVGGDAEFNLNRLQNLLDHKDQGLAEAVALNAGAVIWLAELAPDLGSGISMARQQIASKAARDYFHSWLGSARKLATLGDTHV